MIIILPLSFYHLKRWPTNLINSLNDYKEYREVYNLFSSSKKVKPEAIIQD